MDYSFNIDHAIKYGTDNAIMIRFFQFWISTNLANRKNQFDGRTWTYNTQTALSELMPFWSVKQIRRIVKSLTDDEVLITGNYNKMKNDQTLWYAFKDESMFIPLKKQQSPEIANCPNGQKQLPKRADDNCPNGQTITSYKPYKLPTTKPKGFTYDVEFEKLWNIHNVGDKWAGFKAWSQRSKDYTQDELSKAILVESKKQFGKRHFSTVLNGDIDELIAVNNSTASKVRRYV